MTTVAYHGLNAFRGTKCPMGMRRAARMCVGAEICVADRPIGPVGLAVEGPLTAAFRGDCWSRIGADGRRTADCTPCAPAPTEAEYWALCKNWLALNPSSGTYCEAWMIADRIRYVWAKAWTDARTKRNARTMSKILRVPFLDVDSASRIWIEHAPIDHTSGDVAGIYDHYEAAA